MSDTWAHVYGNSARLRMNHLEDQGVDRQDIRAAMDRAEASRRECVRLARQEFGIVPSIRDGPVPDADSRPTHNGFPTGKPGWCL